MAIEVTERALDNAIRMRNREGHPADAFLRIAVKGGGCSGFAYDLRFDTVARPGDLLVRERDGIKVMVDPKSLQFLDGMVLDFSAGLMGVGFEFKNPNAKSSCGCGKSFGV